MLGAMEELKLLLKAWESAHWELGEAFKGLEDKDVWRRADPKLLSIGELAAHMAYGESKNFGIAVDSPLIDDVNRYYPYAVAGSFHAELGAKAVYDETQRVHSIVRDSFLSCGQDPYATNPSRPGWTWANTLEYMVFHVAYHTGQIYSVRHLMGHETEDN